MTVRDDFAVFILTHDRPHKVVTIDSLRRSGYTGPIFLVVDDQDPSLPVYQELFPDNLLTFSKDDIAARFDEGDPGHDKRSIFYARNACWDLAEQVPGLRYFMQLDDDYNQWSYRTVGRWHDGTVGYHEFPIRSQLDSLFTALVNFHEATPTHTIAFSQGGDHFGGKKSARFAPMTLRRKAMNSFVCDVNDPIEFLGRVNEDVTSYTWHGGRGKLFFTFTSLQLHQLPTQHNTGGMTGLYLDSGTYIKSMFTLMWNPSSVTVRQMGLMSRRLHHHVNWDHTVPKILNPAHRKP